MRLRHLVILVLVPLALSRGLPGAWAEDPAKEPAAVPDATPEQRRALAEADALDAQVEDPFARGRFAQALPLARRSLALKEPILGREHSHVARSMNNVAVLLENFGQGAQARGLQEASQAITSSLVASMPPGRPGAATG